MLNTRIHDGNPFLRGSELFEDDSMKLAVEQLPKLIIVAIDADKKVNESIVLKRALVKILDSLHPEGTVAFGIPRPWHVHGARIYGEVNTERSCSALKTDLPLNFVMKTF